AFAADPVWSVALARADGTTDHQPAYWRRFVASSIAQGGVWLLEDGAAVSVWVPPGGEELSAEGIAELDRFNMAHLGNVGAREMPGLSERFESTHPRDAPHASRSLLAPHPDPRGRGIGQALLAENLASWDAAGAPAYLESTNPANDHRYARA